MIRARAAGNPRLVFPHSKDNDQYALGATRAPWFHARVWRWRTYEPYFDKQLGWSPPAWAYKDIQAIYSPASPNDDPRAREHPDWVLRDTDGNKLYVPFQCRNGTCEQYAADIGNQAFRDDWIAAAKSIIARGYKGLYVDDVNMVVHVGNGQGVNVTPVDPRTNQPMTLESWRTYMAEFVEQIRWALPGVELVHNSMWWLGDIDPLIRRQLAAADFQNVERGFNDPNIPGGTGPNGFETLMAWIDRQQATGRGVVIDSYTASAEGREYDLAAWLLVNQGRSAISTASGMTPGDWWAPYGHELGDALGWRRWWRGVWRRDFQRGIALVNQPGNPEFALTLDRSYRDTTGRVVSKVTLGPSRGAVLRVP